MTKTRVGVVGVGHLGYHHARIYAALGEAELVGVADCDPANAAKATADFGAPSFASVDELVAQGIQAASVAVPTSAHRDVALRLLDAGVDVLVEKPLAVNVAEAEDMARAAEAHGRILQVGHIERFNGAVIALFDAVRRPRFIECHRLSPYPNRGDDVSVVLDLMIHDIEILLAMDRSGIAAVDAVGVPVFSKFEDIANARIRFNSGCVANVTASRVSVERMRKIRIFEQDAYMSTDYKDQQVLVYRKKVDAPEAPTNPMDLIDIEPLDVQREEPLRLELESFLRCVRERSTPVVSGQDGLAALRLAEEIMATIRAQA